MKSSSELESVHCRSLAADVITLNGGRVCVRFFYEGRGIRDIVSKSAVYCSSLGF